MFDSAETCLFCLQKATRISFTKHKLPTLYCGNCGVRVFIRLKASLSGLAILRNVADDMREALRNGAPELVDEIARFDRELMARYTDVEQQASPQIAVTEAARTGTHG